MKRDYSMWVFCIIAAILIGGIILTPSQKLPNKLHNCLYKQCPYKGVATDTAYKAVAAYTGEEEGNAYSLDMLHFQSPEKSYEELEIMLDED